MNKPVEEWHGVRNFTARNNMKAMQLGDLAFFYHSNIGKEIVGIMKVVKLAHPDSTAEPNDKGKIVWECVDVVGVEAAAQAGDARDDQADAGARQHGAGQAVAPVGAAGDADGMGADLQDGRAEEGAVARQANGLIDRQLAFERHAGRQLGRVDRVAARLRALTATSMPSWKVRSYFSPSGRASRLVSSVSDCTLARVATTSTKLPVRVQSSPSAREMSISSYKHLDAHHRLIGEQGHGLVLLLLLRRGQEDQDVGIDESCHQKSLVRPLISQSP